MLQKHSKDIIFIVIILILIGIIWGVEKNIWILIAINVVVIMVGLLYVNSTEGVSPSEIPHKKDKTNNYFTLRTITESEINECLNEVDYDDFESVKKGKEILSKFRVGDNRENIVNKIKNVCKYDIEIYYLGLISISLANINLLKEKDYEYINLGIELVKSSNKLKTKLIDFLNNTKL